MRPSVFADVGFELGAGFVRPVACGGDLRAVCVATRVVVGLVGGPFGKSGGGIAVFAFVPNKGAFAVLVGQTDPSGCACFDQVGDEGVFGGTSDVGEVGSDDRTSSGCIAPRQRGVKGHITTVAIEFFGVSKDALAFAGCVAPIPVVGVAVVALFDAFLHKAVTALGFFTSKRTSACVAVVRAVVAFFARLDKAVAASGFFASGCAGACVAVVRAVVAFFDIFLDETIAAFGDLAGVGASVVVVFVGVIALFGSGLDDAVTTSGFDAGVEASVGIGVISVVALFAFLEDAIAASRKATKFGATIGVFLISIVTGFDAHMHKAVSADVEFASVCARIVVVFVGVIALFDIFLNESIATGGSDAGVEASIVVVGVSVVALFAFLDKAVAALGDLARLGTGCIIGIFAAVVALFYACLDISIPADGQFTRTCATVGVVAVSVVAFFRHSGPA